MISVQMTALDPSINAIQSYNPGFTDRIIRIRPQIAVSGNQPRELFMQRSRLCHCRSSLIVPRHLKILDCIGATVAQPATLVIMKGQDLQLEMPRGRQPLLRQPSLPEDIKGQQLTALPAVLNLIHPETMPSNPVIGISERNKWSTGNYLMRIITV